MSAETVTLYRPIGAEELRLIEEAAERLVEFNDNIVGEIEVIARFEVSDERAMSGEAS
jgi:hypothetical protein